MLPPSILDPRAGEILPQPAPPAMRVPRIDGARIVVVRTMPPGSGVESLADLITSSAARRGGDVTDFTRRDFMADDPAERNRLRENFDAAVLVAGPTATTTELTFRYADQLERAGLPCAIAVFAPYAATARYGAQMTATRPGHILFSLRREDDEADIASLLSILTDPRDGHAKEAGQRSTIETLLADARSEDDAIEALHRAGITDGLPVVLPTATRVARMCGGTSLPADTIITTSFRPEGRTVTVRDVAANAVMAGALPVHLPAILAAASIMGKPLVDSMTRSVNSFAFAQYLSGPYAIEAGVVGGMNALGPGNRSNGAIGRALGLMMRNLGGCAVGVNSTPAQGNPAAGGLVFTDNRDHPANCSASGCAPFSEMIRSIVPGAAPHQSWLTMFAGGFTHLGNFYYGGFEELRVALDQPDLPAGALVLLSDKMAQQLAREGFTRESLEQALHSAVRRPMGQLRKSGFYPLREAMTQRSPGEGYGAWPESYLGVPDEAEVPVYAPGSILVGVVGSDAASVGQVWLMGAIGTASIDDFR